MVSPGPDYAVTLKQGLLGLAMIVSQSVLAFDNLLRWFGVPRVPWPEVARSAKVRDRCTDRDASGTRRDRCAPRGMEQLLASALNPKVTLGWYALVAVFVSTAPVKRRFDAVAHRI